MTKTRPNFRIHAYFINTALALICYRKSRTLLNSIHVRSIVSVTQSLRQVMRCHGKSLRDCECAGDVKSLHEVINGHRSAIEFIRASGPHAIERADTLMGRLFLGPPINGQDLNFLALFLYHIGDGFATHLPGMACRLCDGQLLHEQVFV